MNEHNVFKCSLFNFDMTKKSLIAFCNDDQDELFRYYDNRNKTRLNKLHKKAQFTHQQTVSLIEMAKQSVSVLKHIQNLEGGKLSI